MNVVELNKMIGEFMGIKKSYVDNFGEQTYIDPIDGSDIYTLLYHHSWAWLMPVVIKLQSMNRLEIDFSIKFGDHGDAWCTLRTRLNMKARQGHAYDVVVCEDNVGIESVYKTVVETVRAHNKLNELVLK